MAREIFNYLHIHIVLIKRRHIYSLINKKREYYMEEGSFLHLPLYNGLESGPFYNCYKVVHFIIVIKWYSNTNL